MDSNSPCKDLLFSHDPNLVQKPLCSVGTVLKNDLNCTEIPYRFSVNNVEITVTVLRQPVPNIHVVGIYRSKTVRRSQLIDALTHRHKSVLTKPTVPTILLGDFNINLMQETAEQRALRAFLITNRGYT